MWTKWYWRIASLFITAAVMFPLYLLWLDMSPLKAVVGASFAGVMAVIGVIGAQKNAVKIENEEKEWFWCRLSLPLRIVLGAVCAIVAVVVLVAVYYDEEPSEIIIDTIMIAAGIVWAVIYNVSQKLSSN